MSKYNATIIKTGNSYALRVPISYIKQNNLKLGQKTFISPPIKTVVQNRKAIELAFKQLNDVDAFGSISDPGKWQQSIREDRPMPERS